MTDTAEMTREEISSLLRFYAESGLDFPISDEPINRFELVDEKKATAPNTASQAAPASSSNDPHAPATIEMDPRKRKKDEPKRPQQAAQVVIPTEEVVSQAVEAAQAAEDLDALKSVVERFEGCNLKRSARSTVFEGGKRGAKIMLIGGCPSRDDDMSGAAFSGADGILLDKMLQAIGLSRHEDTYLGFCAPWATPGGSAPTPIHLDICAPFLARQIELAAPEIIILLGNAAARQVFQSKQTIANLRGKWTNLPNFNIDAMAIFSPSMLRAQPKMKRNAWLDLLALKAKLQN